MSPPLFHRLLRLACTFALLGGFVAATRAEEAGAEVQRLIQSGETAKASERLEQALSQKPRDAQLRFLKAVMQSDAGHAEEAIDTFRKISTDYPELPEPYNNLAVLYAAQGDFERARTELEVALRARPGYALAYQNLGDVYLQLSRKAYLQALELDPGNSSLRPKLTLLRELTSAKADAPARITP